MKKIIFSLMLIIANITSYSQTKNVNWHNFVLDTPTNFYCEHCKENLFEREINIYAIISDTIYFTLNRPDIEMCNEIYCALHFSKIPEDILDNKTRNNKVFNDYVKTWTDSLSKYKITNDKAEDFNIINFIEFNTCIHKKAPFGFISNYGWNMNSYGGITPHFEYFNMSSKKTIKYIDVYFNIYNDVDDKCYLKYDGTYTGHIRCVGPVKPKNTGLWNWDEPTHYTSRDASYMKITKLVITYMDKTVKVLTGNNIKYDR